MPRSVKFETQVRRLLFKSNEVPQINIGGQPGKSISIDSSQLFPEPTKRELAYSAIDSERDYQDGLGSDRTDGMPRSVGDYITMLQYYNRQLIEEWTMNPGNDQALHVMRKIAGIAVHCMEDYGAPRRELKTTTHF